MIRFKGQTVNGGAVRGPVRVLASAKAASASAAVAADPEAELRRIDAAVVRAQTQIDALLEGSGPEDPGTEATEILGVQRMMLEDPDYREMIRNLVCAEKVSAENAVARTGEHFARTFAETDDAYMQARAEDVRDVSKRLVDCLSGAGEEEALAEPTVLVAREIPPSVFLRPDRNLILATVSTGGSATSHASILARSAGIPAIVNAQIDLADVRTGMRALVDGTDGSVVLDPDAATEAAWSAAAAAHGDAPGADLVRACAGRIELCANVAGPDDLADGLPAVFAGVGLFRTEFLYLGRPDLPGEEEQVRTYRTVLERAGGRKVVARTFDLGADKTAEALPCGPEENPALGCRGIRFALAHPDVFRTQLRALLRAAAHGDLRIMYPMIASCGEVTRIKSFVDGVAAELAREGTAFRVPPQGVMIETPAAALIADELAACADFFSIGTNDLTQYTLAVDRGGAGLEDFRQPRHPAVLKLIRQVADAAHSAGIPVCICGELAADPALTDLFCDLRIDSLSIPPTLGESGAGRISDF